MSGESVVAGPYGPSVVVSLPLLRLAWHACTEMAEHHYGLSQSDCSAQERLELRVSSEDFEQAADWFGHFVKLATQKETA